MTPHELIVGYDEYRQVIHREPHFRRAFAEVFRSRSLLFLGAGLSDPHLLGLFEEILALGGPNPQPHFAVLFEKDKVDRRYLQTRLNTILIELSDYPDIELFLEELKIAVSAERCRVSNWSYSMQAPARVLNPTDTSDLELVRGRIVLPRDGECIALSAGVAPHQPFVFNDATKQLIDEARQKGLLAKGAEPAELPPGSNVTRYPGAPILVGVARDTSEKWDKRDLRIIFKTTQQLLDTAAKAGFHTLRAQMLASGKTRHFPARFSLTQMVRAYADWYRAQAHPPKMRLILHVYARDVVFDLSAGRVDLAEILTCEDVRFWGEVVGNEKNAVENVERQLLFRRGDSLVSEVAAHFDIIGDAWSVSVTPRPTRNARRSSYASVRDKTLDELGVMPGSTLRFRPEET